MNDWKNYASVALVAFMIAIIVRVSGETISGNGRRISELDGRLQQIDNRMLLMETKTHPATASRFTADDAACVFGMTREELDRRVAECRK